MSDEAYEKFLIKGSPFLFPQEICLEAIKNLILAKQLECRIAEYMLSHVKPQRDFLSAKYDLLAKKFGTVVVDLDKYEEGLIMPLQLAWGVAHLLIKDKDGVCKQIDLIYDNHCQEFLQYYEKSLPKCTAMISADKNSWYKVLHQAHEYCPDFYYQVGVKVAQITFLDIRNTIKTSQKSKKH